MDGFIADLRTMPAKVVYTLMVDWTIRQAREVAEKARVAAPRDRNPRRRKPESVRLWRSIAAAKVRRLRKFPKDTVARALAFGASKGGKSGGRSSRPRRRPRNGKVKPGVYGPTPPKRGYHFHLVNLGTRRRFTKAGAHRGAARPNPFFKRIADMQMQKALQDLRTEFKASYERALQYHFKNVQRRIKSGRF